MTLKNMELIDPFSAELRQKFLANIGTLDFVMAAGSNFR